MGATLNTAVGTDAYTLSDRASWEVHANKSDFKIMVEGDKRLFNPYGVMLIDPVRCPSVNSKGGRAFINWLISFLADCLWASMLFASLGDTFKTLS